MTLSYQLSLALQAYRELAPELDQAQRLPLMPSLKSILNDLGPLPPEALFLGIAEDGLPVLLNLFDPVPGPFLIIADSGSGKTAFLKMLAGFSQIARDPGDISFAVITGYLNEWTALETSPNSLGIWPSFHESAGEFIKDLASWADRPFRGSQTVLLLVDDLEKIIDLEMEAARAFQWLLKHGPARGVWPIATINAARVAQLPVWVNLFHTRIFGCVSQPELGSGISDDASSNLASLFPGIQFTLLRPAGWLRFWIPESN